MTKEAQIDDSSNGLPTPLRWPVFAALLVLEFVFIAGGAHKVLRLGSSRGWIVLDVIGSLAFLGHLAFTYTLAEELLTRTLKTPQERANATRAICMFLVLFASAVIARHFVG